MSKTPSSSMQPCFFTLLLIIVVILSFATAACPPEHPHYFFGNNNRSTAANFDAATLANCDTITIENIDFTSGGNSLYLGFPPLANRKSITLRNMHLTATTSGELQFALNWYFSGTLDNIDELIIENNIVETTNGGVPSQVSTVLFNGHLTNVRRLIYRNNTLKLSKFIDFATTSSNFLYGVGFTAGSRLNSTTNLIVTGNTIEVVSGTSTRRSFLRTRIFSIFEAIINITTIDLSSNIVVARSLSTKNLRTELFSAPQITMFQEAPGVVSQLTSVNVKNNYFNATIVGESGVIFEPTIRATVFEPGAILGLNAFVAASNIAEVGCTMTNSSEGCGFVVFYGISLTGEGGGSFIKNIEISNSHLVQDTIVTTSGPLLALARIEGQSEIDGPTVGTDIIPAMLNNLTVHSCSVLVKNFTGPAITTFSTRFSIVFITAATIANISDGIFMRNCSVLFAHDSTVVTGGALWYNVYAVHLFSILDMSRASIANAKEIVLMDNQIRRLAAQSSSSSSIITESSHHLHQHEQQIFTQGRVGAQIFKASGDLRNIGKLTVENNVVTDLNFGVYLDDREFSQAQLRVQFFMDLHIVAVDVTGEVFQPGITSFGNNNNNNNDNSGNITHPTILFNNNTISNMRFEWSLQGFEVKYNAFIRPDIQLFTAVSISDSPSTSTISILSNGISNIRAISRSPLANRINFENVIGIYNPFETLKGNPLYPSVTKLQDELSGRSNIRATIISIETLSSVGNFLVDSNVVSDITCINCEVTISTSLIERATDVSHNLKFSNNSMKSIFGISMEAYHYVGLLFSNRGSSYKYKNIGRFIFANNNIRNTSLYSGEILYNPTDFRITGGAIVLCRINAVVSFVSAIIFINNTITDFFTTALGLNNGVQISDVQGEIKNISGSFSSSTPTTFSSPSVSPLDNNNNINYEHEVADLMDHTEERNWAFVEKEMTGIVFLSNSISNGACRGACKFAVHRSYTVEAFDRVLIRDNTMNHLTVMESGQLRSSGTLSSESIEVCIVQVTLNVLAAPRSQTSSSSTSILVIVNNNIEHMKLRASYIGSDTDIAITFFDQVGLVPLLYFAHNSISSVSAHITYRRRQTATVAALFTRGIFHASSEQQICRLILKNISVHDVNVFTGLDLEALYSPTSTVALVVTSSIGYHSGVQNQGTQIEVSLTNSSLLRVVSNGSQGSNVAGYCIEGFSSILLADSFTVSDIEMNGIVASTNSSAQTAETKITETNVAVLFASRSIENVRKSLVISGVTLINVHVAGSIIHTGILIAEDVRESSLVTIDSARLSGIRILRDPTSSLLRISALLLTFSHNDPSISNVKNITISNVVVSDVRMSANDKNAGGIFGGDISITLMSDETSKGLVQHLSHLLISDSSIELSAPSSTSELLTANGGVGVAAAILNGLAYPLQSTPCSFVFSNVSVRAVIGDSSQSAAAGMLYVTNSIKMSTRSPTESDLVIGRPMNTMIHFKFRNLHVDIDIQGNQHRNFSSSRDVIPSSVFFAGDNIQLNSTSYRHMTNRLTPTIEIEHCIIRQKSADFLSSALFATSSAFLSSALFNGTNTSIVIRNNLVHSESRNLGSSSAVSFASDESHLVSGNSLNIEIDNNEFQTVLLSQDTSTNTNSKSQWTSQVSVVELNSLSSASHSPSHQNHFVNINNNNNLLSIGIGDIGSSLIGNVLKVSAISLLNVSSLDKGVFDISMHDINVEVSRSSNNNNQNPSISLDVSLLSVDGVSFKNASGSINASIHDCRVRISPLGTNDHLSQFSLLQLPFALTDSSNITFENNVMDVASSGPASISFVAITEADSSSSSSHHSSSRITFHNNTMDLRSSPVSICDLENSTCCFMDFAFDRQFTSLSSVATTSSITFGHNSFLTKDHQRVLSLVSTSGSAPLPSSSSTCNHHATLLNLTFLHQNTFGRPSARRILLDDTSSSSSLLQMTQFNLGCSETANSWPQYVERQFLSFQTAKRQQNVNSPTVHWLCNQGFSHSTSPSHSTSSSYSRSFPTLSTSESHESTETKQPIPIPKWISPLRSASDGMLAAATIMQAFVSPTMVMGSSRTRSAFFIASGIADGDCGAKETDLERPLGVTSSPLGSLIKFPKEQGGTATSAVIGNFIFLIIIFVLFFGGYVLFQQCLMKTQWPNNKKYSLKKCLFKSQSLSALFLTSMVLLGPSLESTVLLVAVGSVPVLWKLLSILIWFVMVVGVVFGFLVIYRLILDRTQIEVFIRSSSKKKTKRNKRDEETCSSAWLIFRLKQLFVAIVFPEGEWQLPKRRSQLLGAKKKDKHDHSPVHFSAKKKTKFKYLLPFLEGYNDRFGLNRRFFLVDLTVTVVLSLCTVATTDDRVGCKVLAIASCTTLGLYGLITLFFRPNVELVMKVCNPFFSLLTCVLIVYSFIGLSDETFAALMTFLSGFMLMASFLTFIGFILPVLDSLRIIVRKIKKKRNSSRRTDDRSSSGDEDDLGSDINNNNNPGDTDLIESAMMMIPMNEDHDDDEAGAEKRTTERGQENNNSLDQLLMSENNKASPPKSN